LLNVQQCEQGNEEESSGAEAFFRLFACEGKPAENELSCGIGVGGLYIGIEANVVLRSENDFKYPGPAIGMAWDFTWSQ
jgi:hypothetical protein